jgi:hypothetical protein
MSGPRNRNRHSRPHGSGPHGSARTKPSPAPFHRVSATLSRAKHARSRRPGSSRVGARHVVPPGWHGDWHPVLPHGLLAVNLSGSGEMTASDGETRPLLPGNGSPSRRHDRPGHISRLTRGSDPHGCKRRGSRCHVCGLGSGVWASRDIMPGPGRGAEVAGGVGVHQGAVAARGS